MSSGSRRRGAVVAVYLVGLLQGVALVAFPAAASVLQASDGYGLDRSEYGALFAPQVVLAIAGALALPAVARALRLERVLLVGVAADATAMVLLTASYPLRDEGFVYPMLLVATAALGLGFGLTVSTLSTYAGAPFPDRREVAVTSLNVMLGLGTALSPLLVAAFTDLAEWWYLPLLTAVGLGVMLVVAGAQRLPAPSAPAQKGRARVPGAFWLFAGALVLYGVCETMFGNWGTTLLRDGGVDATDANYGLAAFWAAITGGRLLIAVAPRSLPSTAIYLVLPWTTAAALLLIASATGTAQGVVLFGAGGLACSGFFPMTVGFGETTFPGIVEVATGRLVAAYQVGYGIAAFGAGALESTVSLPTLFRVSAVLALAMGVLAVPVAARQRRPAAAAARP